MIVHFPQIETLVYAFKRGQPSQAYQIFDICRLLAIPLDSALCMKALLTIHDGTFAIVVSSHQSWSRFISSPQTLTTFVCVSRHL